MISSPIGKLFNRGGKKGRKSDERNEKREKEEKAMKGTKDRGMVAKKGQM